MHTVLKKTLLALMLAGAATGTARAADILYQAGNKAMLPPLPGEANYLNEADLISLANAAPAASAAQAQPAPLSPIPEPPVYIMLLIGVGLVSLVARRSMPPPKFSTET
ncbi:PEP-CTERM sorting domain-containing protein [Massilia sp. Root418]|uniref:PEP-CTERM sorting domain-containing protein n=1 Tax=Massilia sp. Root418 TaxID=1736532 RepID=UPI000A742D60|nr:PEP-CTERM sorting domain-containing protein [Massilia sp. Root418]